MSKGLIRHGVRAGLLVLIALAAPPVAGKDLGVSGRTFPIIETDILETMKGKLQEAERTGKVDQLNQEFLARSRARIQRPTPVAGLVKTTAPRSFLYDPSIVVPEDYADQNGRVFARRGDLINPLVRMPNYQPTLIFIDGDDPAQLQFGLRRLHQAGEENARLILVKGAPIDLMQKNRVEMFFDQEGSLTAKFGLRQVPAVIVREGDKLRVNEVLP